MRVYPAYRRRRPLHSPLMGLPPYVRYLLWRVVAAAVTTAADIARAVRRLPWKRFAYEFCAFCMACLLIAVLIAINIGLASLERF